MGKIYLQTLFFSCLMMACSSGSELIPEEKPEEGPVPPSEAVETVAVMAEDILNGNGHSRSAFTLEDDRLKFSWTEGDQIGVCPSNGSCPYNDPADLCHGPKESGMFPCGRQFPSD